MRKNKMLLLSTVAMTCIGLGVYAQGTVEEYVDNDEYSDAVNWDLKRTTDRNNLANEGESISNMSTPGYNPNVLRPAGDGLGRHEATQDINMQNNGLSSVSRISGNGTMVVEGLDYPTDDTQAANKFYVDTMISELAEDLDEDVTDVVEGLDNLTGGDGITRSGDTFSVDNTVVRTSGDQNIAGVKNFETRINVSSSSNRPLDSRSHADGGVGLYGRSTNGNSGYGVVGMTDGASGIGVRAETTDPLGTSLQTVVPTNIGTFVDFVSSGATLGTLSAKDNSTGTGLVLNGLAWPSQVRDATSKEYVDQMIADLREELTQAAVSPFVRVASSVTWLNADEPEDNLYYYSCLASTMNTDGSRTCTDLGIRSPVRPGQHYMRIVESNIRVVYNLSFLLEGSCELGDRIGYDVEVPFYGGSLAPTTEEFTLLYSEVTPQSWGYEPGDLTYGAGTLTDGCNVRSIVDITSPDDLDFSRRTTFTIFDADYEPIPAGYTVVAPD